MGKTGIENKRMSVYNKTGMKMPVFCLRVLPHMQLPERKDFSMIRACIFDMDGTVADTLASIAGFANGALRQCGYPEIGIPAYRTLVGNGADTLMRRMLKTVAGEFTEEEVARLRQVYDRAYEADPMHLVTEYPGVGAVLRTLKEQGVRCAGVYNTPEDLRCQVAALIYTGLFDAVRGQRPETPLKPAPDGALLLAEQLGVKPEECLYIGDTWVDMQTGKNAGMETVGVLWGFRDREELENAGACHVIAAPEELLLLAGVHAGFDVWQE